MNNAPHGKFSTRKIDIVLKFQDGSSYKIHDLHISINIKKTISVQPNSATFEIYNISQKNRENIFDRTFVKKNGGKYIEITASVGDAEIYRGFVVNTFSTRLYATGDWKTTLYCGDSPFLYSAKAKKDSVIPAGTNKLDAIYMMETIADYSQGMEKLKVAIAGLMNNDCLKGKSFLRAITINGNIIENIKKILKDCLTEDKISIFIDENKIHIEDVTRYAKVETLILDSGFIDPPALNESGVKTNVLFRNDVTLLGKMKISFKNFEVTDANANSMQLTRRHITGAGDFQITEIEHKIDNFSDNLAETIITGRNIEGIYE